MSNDAIPDEAIAAWSAFLRAHAATVRLIDRDVHQRSGLPLRWYDVLLELNAAAGRRLRMQELSDTVVLSRTRVSRVVDELVAADLVRRERNPSDGRSSYAVITEAGRRALKRAAPVYLASIRAHFGARLSNDSLATIRRAMEILATTPSTPDGHVHRGAEATRGHAAL